MARLGPLPHAPNWYACVGRGFFRAWPRYARSESDDHVVDSPHHTPGPVRRNRNRMTTTSIHRTTRLAPSGAIEIG